MELLAVISLLLLGFHSLRVRDQRQRIALLGRHLGQYQIEKLMEALTDGYLRAMGETQDERRAQLWSSLAIMEADLGREVTRFAEDFSRVWSDQTQVSTLAYPIPYGTKLFPRRAFDLRHALTIHARGISQLVLNRQELSQRDKAYTLTAEILLMQHSCHWFCRSKAVASARMLLRHKTHYAQLLASVSPATHEAYGALLAGRAERAGL